MYGINDLFDFRERIKRDFYSKTPRPPPYDYFEQNNEAHYNEILPHQDKDVENLDSDFFNIGGQRNPSQRVEPEMVVRLPINKHNKVIENSSFL